MRHANASNAIHIHGLGGLVSGLLEGVQEATDDERVVEWLRREGASDEDIAEMREGLREAKEELGQARIELRRELAEVDAKTIDTRSPEKI